MGYGTGTLGTSMSAQTPQVNRLGYPLKVGSQRDAVLSVIKS